MVYADYERQRLVDQIDPRGAYLQERIEDMGKRLKDNKSKKSDQLNNSRKITQLQFEAVDLWVKVSSLRNDLESLKTVLVLMLEYSKKPLENEIIGYDPLAPDSYHPDNITRRHSCDSIQTRLNEMIVEIDGIIRQNGSRLVGMSLATQTVS